MLLGAVEWSEDGDCIMWESDKRGLFTMESFYPLMVKSMCGLWGQVMAVKLVWSNKVPAVICFCMWELFRGGKPNLNLIPIIWSRLKESF